MEEGLKDVNVKKMQMGAIVSSADFRLVRKLRHLSMWCMLSKTTTTA